MASDSDSSPPAKRQRADVLPSSAPFQELDPLLVPADFPFELFIEILTRLPAKTLGKFKCVSKSLLSLISTPTFIKTHIEIASRRADYSQCGLILNMLPPNRHSHLKKCSVRSVLGPEPSVEVTDTDYPGKSPSKSIWIVGSSYGLVCVTVDEKDLFLWNPLLRKFKKVPDIVMELKHGCFVMFGFGYDVLNEDYKIVRIFCTFGVGSVCESNVEVYSLKKDSWQRIGAFQGGIPLVDSGQYANGCLHWAASDGAGDWKFVSLDLAQESYKEIERPSLEEQVTDWRVGVLGGCLSVLYDRQRYVADVWVMKEYGVKESWTKVVSVCYVEYPGERLQSTPGRALPVCWLGNSKMLLVLQSMLVVYDMESNTCKWYNEIDELEDVSMFVESLVSPDIYEGDQRQLQLDVETCTGGSCFSHPFQHHGRE